MSLSSSNNSQKCSLEQIVPRHVFKKVNIPLPPSPLPAVCLSASHLISLALFLWKSNKNQLRLRYVTYEANGPWLAYYILMRRNDKWITSTDWKPWLWVSLKTVTLKLVCSCDAVKDRPMNYYKRSLVPAWDGTSEPL